MRWLFYIVSSVVLHILVSSAVSAQGLEQIWLHAPTQVRVSEKTRLIADMSPRFGMEDPGVDQLLVRSGIQHQIRKNLQATLGFDTVDNYTPTRNHENRLWQQLHASTNLKEYTLSARLRVEERHFSGKEGESIRARLMLKSAQKIGASPFSVVYYDELFVTMNTMPDGPVRGIDRNRLFGGIGYAIDRHKSVEAGYRVEYINKTDIDDETRRQLVVQLCSTF